MSALHIIFDPTDLLGMNSVEQDEEFRRAGIKVARLPIHDDLENQDIYAIAKRLAELLLEQLAHP